MQILNYTFDKTAKTVTFTDYTTIRLDSIRLITNATDGIIIYNFADSTLKGTVATNVLTLAYDTSAMDNADKLTIVYEDANYDAGKTDDAAVVGDVDGSIFAKLRGIGKILNDIWDTTNHSIKVTLTTTLSGILNGIENDSTINYVGRRIDAFQGSLDAVSDTSAQKVIDAQETKSLYITDISISTDTSQSVKLQDNTGTPVVLVPRKFLPANSVWSKHFTNPIKAPVGKQIDVVCGGSSGNVTVEIEGYAI